MVKNIVVLGAAYGGNRAAEVLAKTVSADYRVIVVDQKSHFNHLYLFPRYGVLPGHADKCLIPFTGIFDIPNRDLYNLKNKCPVSDLAAKLKSVVIGEKVDQADLKPTFIHARVVDVQEHKIVLDRALIGEEIQLCMTETSGDDLETIEFEYLIYALGCQLPQPIALPAVERQHGIDALQTQQEQIAKSKDIVIVGGGALGIQYASDIAELYNSDKYVKLRPAGSVAPKKVTIIHSRKQFLPIYHKEVDREVKRRFEHLGIEMIMGERVSEWHEDRLVTETSREIEFDCLLKCTGQQANVKPLQKTLIPTYDILNTTGFIHVLPSLQIADKENKAIAGGRIFAIGDCADTGSVKAGHTAWRQANVAAQNVIHLIDGEYKDRTFIGVADAEPVKIKQLLDYEPTPPMIKVTTGLTSSVGQMVTSAPNCAPEEMETTVTVYNDGPVEGGYEVLWDRMVVPYVNV